MIEYEENLIGIINIYYFKNFPTSHSEEESCVKNCIFNWILSVHFQNDN